MPVRIHPRSLSLPIFVGFLAVSLAIAMLVAWILVIVSAPPLTYDTWLLVLGIISLTIIAFISAFLAVFLFRAMLDERRQITFIDSVTHELRSPLASILLCLDTLARPDLPDHQRERLQKMIRGDAERLSDFIEDILTANRIGVSRPLGEPIPLRPVVEHAIEQVCSRHRLEPAVIRADYHAEPTALADRASLELALRNILDNAIKYAQGTPDVEVTLTQSGQRAHIQVEDQGIGMTPAEARRVLRRFYRADRPEVRARPGTGLGLFVVDALLRQMGGRIRVHSKGPTRGAIFTIEVPLDSGEGGAA